MVKGQITQKDKDIFWTAVIIALPAIIIINLFTQYFYDFIKEIIYFGIMKISISTSLPFIITGIVLIFFFLWVSKKIKKLR